MQPDRQTDTQITILHIPTGSEIQKIYSVAMTYRKDRIYARSGGTMPRGLENLGKRKSVRDGIPWLWAFPLQEEIDGRFSSNNFGILDLQR